MSTKLYVELDGLVHLLKATEHDLTSNARALMVVWLDYAKRIAVPMPPPDPPDHGPHLGGDGANQNARGAGSELEPGCALQNEADGEVEGVGRANARMREAKSILVEVCAALDAQKEQGK